MGKFIRNVIVITAAVNLAASVYYLLAGVVPLGIFWEATVSYVKAGGPACMLLLCGIGGSLVVPRVGSVVRYSLAGVCLLGSIYFGVVSNVAFYRVIFTHTSVMSLALAALWLYAATVAVVYATSLRQKIVARATRNLGSVTEEIVADYMEVWSRAVRR